MSSLQYFGFVLTTAVYLDSCVHDAFRKGYSFGKKRVPNALDSLLEYAELRFLAIYKPVYAWISNNAFSCLEVADNGVEKGLAKFEDTMPFDTTEFLTKIREGWKWTATQASESWKGYGVVLGTLILLLTTLQVILTSILTSKPFQALYNTFQNSETVVKAKGYFQEKVQPCLVKIGKTGHQSMSRLAVKSSIALEVFKDKVDPIINRIVESPHYKRAFHYVQESKEKVGNTQICKQMVKYAEPYCGSTFEALWRSEMYTSIKEKLTPIKQE